MAHTDSPPQSSAAEAEAPPRAGRRNIRLLAIGVAAFLVLAAVVVWNRVAVHRLDQVNVAWAGPPQCRGAQVTGPPERAPAASGTDPWAGPVIAAQRGMRCTLLVEVRNDGGGAVHVEHAVLPLMGANPGGPVIKVDTASEPAAWDSSSTDDLDLTRMLDVTLEPDQTYTFEVPLVFRESGCSGGVHGGKTSLSDFPTVTVSSLLHTAERAAVNDLNHIQAGQARGCE